MVLLDHEISLDNDLVVDRPAGEREAGRGDVKRGGGDVERGGGWRLRAADFPDRVGSLFDLDRNAQAEADAEILTGRRSVEHAGELEGRAGWRVAHYERRLDHQ